jgi:hypothetical protein
MTRALVLACLLVGTADAKQPPKQPPPPVVIARVLKAEAVGSEHVITAGAGSLQGVGMRAACTFVDDKDRDVPDLTCVIIRVDKRTTIAKTTASMDQIKALARVRLRTPAEK